MPISAELQAKIDALEDEDFKARILHLLTSPAKKDVSDEEIFASSVASYMRAKEQQDRLRNWSDEEVVAFARYFNEKKPDSYVEFLRQEREFNEIESKLAWSFHILAKQWMPDLDESDTTGLFRKFRRYVRSLSN
ncbi:hypothetical protein K4L06_19700 [Lysobacter sp. BMK333-48F3]|uniref:hypothetical protein n=1 Tax=Lysobacter sp. BMK333-48F3 TaxID=2867962 RepID=UPI001C8C8142|nr:hypothetical protein [Lysobacter sp. BMK333-48F3]MBX9403542.1 hypothetical protein [Lysobacter sp. BMK333-48F3]